MTARHTQKTTKLKALFCVHFSVSKNYLRKKVEKCWSGFFVYTLCGRRYAERMIRATKGAWKLNDLKCFIGFGLMIFVPFSINIVAFLSPPARITSVWSEVQVNEQCGWSVQSIKKFPFQLNNAAKRVLTWMQFQRDFLLLLALLPVTLTLTPATRFKMLLPHSYSTELYKYY